MEGDVLDGTHTKELCTGKGIAATIHECSKSLAEFIRHALSAAGSLVLTRLGDVVLACAKACVRVIRGEVRGKHGCGDLATVGAIANERVDQTRLLQWLLDQPTGSRKTIKV